MNHFIRGVVFCSLLSLCLRSASQGHTWTALAASLIAGAMLTLEVLVWVGDRGER